MSPLAASLEKFKGQFIKDCEDQIEAICKAHGKTVSTLDPTNGISSNIDYERNRIDIVLDADMRVTNFKVG